MAKRRKTLKQKRLNDLRPSTELATPLSTSTVSESEPPKKTFTFTFDQPKNVQRQSYATALQNHPFLTYDLKKTLIVTGAIVIAQLALYFAMTSL